MDLPYKIVQKIGDQKKRKFGKVFLVRHIHSGADAIMKVVFKNETNEHLLERLRQEATFTFETKGLPRILEFSESENEILIIKEFQKGIPLLEFWAKIKSRDRLKTLVVILEELQSIFVHLKENNIVHCDLKPSNILVSRVKEEINVEIIDFGLALNITRAEKRKILFPLGYAAPELILNHLDIIDQRTDIFSLGILIWRMFNGKLPLTNPNPSVFTNLQITHPLPDCPELNKEANSVLAKMCYKHVFKTSPNNMPPEEVKILLSDAMDHRYNDLQEIIDAFKIISERKPWYKLI